MGQNYSEEDIIDGFGMPIEEEDASNMQVIYGGPPNDDGTLGPEWENSMIKLP